MESFFAGLIGFLVGRGLAPRDAMSIVQALEKFLGFEPPLGLTGYALKDMEQGKKLKSAVVVRGKTYHAVALRDILKHEAVSVLGKDGAYLEIAPQVKGSSEQESGVVAVQDDQEKVILTVKGDGTHLHSRVYVQDDEVSVTVVLDGGDIYIGKPSSLNGRGFTATTPYISLTRYTADGPCDVLLTAPYRFKESFAIRVRNESGVSRVAQAWVVTST